MLMNNIPPEKIKVVIYRVDNDVFEPIAEFPILSMRAKKGTRIKRQVKAIHRVLEDARHAFLDWTEFKIEKERQRERRKK